jgi:hypothetical protein
VIFNTFNSSRTLSPIHAGRGSLKSKQPGFLWRLNDRAVSGSAGSKFALGGILESRCHIQALQSRSVSTRRFPRTIEIIFSGLARQWRREVMVFGKLARRLFSRGATFDPGPAAFQRRASVSMIFVLAGGTNNNLIHFCIGARLVTVLSINFNNVEPIPTGHLCTARITHNTQTLFVI